jgi:hypothetical protein
MGLKDMGDSIRILGITKGHSGALSSAVIGCGVALSVRGR